jgi:hypothetical protein
MAEQHVEIVDGFELAVNQHNLQFAHGSRTVLGLGILSSDDNTRHSVSENCFVLTVKSE